MFHLSYPEEGTLELYAGDHLLLRHSIVPSIVGYILFQEQIIAGMTSGAVKG